MSRTRCERFAQARSAFVDGSIDFETREVLLAHLSRCPHCRADVAELRRLRSRLGDPGRCDGAAPAGLQDRLVSIAGGQEQDPLWSRPFRRVDAKPLPSRRRRRRRRAALAGTALGSIVIAGAGVGYLAAPAPAAAIPDPTAASRSDFAAAVADQPLGSDALTAVMMVGDKLRSAAGSGGSASANGSDPATAVDAAGVIRAAALPAGLVLTGTEAAALLRAGGRAAERYGVEGTEQITVTSGSAVVRAEVSVESVPGQGSEFTVRDQDGRRLGQGFEPAGTTDSTQWLALLADGYQLSGVRGVELGDRSAAVVEARRPGASSPAARWWVDERTGLLLGRQTFEPSGALVQSSVFDSMKTTSGGFIDHPAPRLTVPVATASMAPANGTRLSVRGWDCQEQLAGMPLTEVRTDVGSDPTLVHLIYGDGVWTVSVFERRGTLTELPQDARLDAASGAYLREGLPRMASWQSGDVTFTVVTDAPVSTMSEVVRSLPHEPTDQPTTMKRIAAGWSRILQLTFG